jgi:hypothetical protein
MIIETVNALDNGSSILWETLNFWDFVLLAISMFVLAAGVFSIVFILWWGLLLILSWGKDDKIKPAINTIRYAVIGIVITVLTIFLFPILWRLLGLDVEQYAQPKRIFEKIEEIWNKIFWNNTGYIWNSADINDIDDFPVDFSDL